MQERRGPRVGSLPTEGLVSEQDSQWLLLSHHQEENVLHKLSALTLRNGWIWVELGVISFNTWFLQSQDYRVPKT